MKQCREYRKLIYDFYDNNLNENDKNELEKHLQTCNECLVFSRRIKQLKQILIGLPKVDVSENFNILLRERLRRELVRQKRPVLKTKFLVPAFALGLLFFVIGWFSLNNFSLLKDNKNIVLKEAINHSNEIKPTGPNVQYVIDQYGVEESGEANKSKIKNFDKNLSDSLKLLKNSEQIRARLTPVSF